jgi:hypothetical protein
LVPAFTDEERECVFVFTVTAADLPAFKQGPAETFDVGYATPVAAMAVLGATGVV